MSTLGRLKTLYYLTLSPIRGNTHQQRLESFYQHQAVDYDDFRERLLHGRDELFAALPVADGQEWIDLGAGTGRNAERFGDRLQKFSSVQLVDLSPSLLEVTHQRIDQHGWSNVTAVHADATSFDPPDESVDLVTFCYSLTMIPGWFAAVENAWRMLKPGGIIGVVDFYVSRKYPDPDHIRHGWFQRTFWPTWFAMDNVFLSPDHLPMLRSRFETIATEERTGKVPWIPLLAAPHYIFVGQKPE
jgi:S-adenosylmethionine-diacylgycerolhomoserine-N-methlytransferase